MKFLGVEIIQSIIAFFQTLREVISLEHIMYVFVGLEILTIIIFVFIVNSVYEVRLMRAVDKLNSYLYNVQYIDDSNLIEFNRRMKRVPKTLRYHWQQYMLYREKSPSHYMSIENCVDRPTKASAFEASIKTFKSLGVVYALLSFLFCCGWAVGLYSVNTDFFITIFTIPLIILFLNYIVIIGLNIKRSANTRDLYQTFYIFNRFIDKAVVTLPDYVDFEVLFTKKEIKKGIPVLNEYIERRQIQEQEEMRRAKENAVQHEMFNFEAAGDKGELVLERAMKEAEILINLKNRLNAEIEQIEKEIDSYKRAYDNTTRDYQKKMQASRENIDRLREQQESTTNRIESNYIRKQQSDEIKKQQQIEKEQEDATLRFNQEINSLAAEIKKRKVEIEEAKETVNKAMLAEYKTYANKIFVEIKDDVAKKVKEERDTLISTRELIARELEESLSKTEQLEKQNKLLVAKSAERDAFIRAKIGQENKVLKNKIIQLQEAIEEKDQHISIISENPQAKIKPKENVSKDVKSKSKGKKQEIIEGEFSFADEKKISEDIIGVESSVNNIAETPSIEEFFEEEKMTNGEFDNDGNYRFPDGSYYDAKGYFHDANGDIFDKEGNIVNQKPIKQLIVFEENVDFDVVEDKGVEIVDFDVAEDEEKESVKTENKEMQSQDAEKEEKENKDSESKEVADKKLEDKKVESKDAENKNEGQLKKKEKVDKKEEKVEKEEQEAEKPKRPVGRPRKHPVVPVEDKPKRPVGRPRKHPVVPVEDKPKRPVGRPRKHPVEPVDNKPKGPVGRPRKNPIENVDEKPKRPRGRPRKVEVDDLKAIEEKIKKQSDILKNQQAELKETIKKVSKK